MKFYLDGECLCVQYPIVTDGVSTIVEIGYSTEYPPWPLIWKVASIRGIPNNPTAAIKMPEGVYDKSQLKRVLIRIIAEAK